MKNKEVEVISWFDRPEWFEIGFQNETKKEADFFEAAFKKYCDFPVKRLLEPACGSGRIVTEMAARGYDVTGFDLSEPSLEFLRERLKKRRLKATVANADMTRFKFPGKFDSAFCTYNSFRVLTKETAAQSHLKCMADAVRSGGLYFLGMHLAPPGCEPTCIERWFGQRDNTHVTTTLRIVDYDLKARTERLRINLLVREFETNGKACAQQRSQWQTAALEMPGENPSPARRIRLPHLHRGPTPQTDRIHRQMGHHRRVRLLV